MLRVTLTWSGTPGSPYYTVLHFDGNDATAAGNVRSGMAAAWAPILPRMTDDLVMDWDGTVFVVDETTGQITNAFTGSAVTFDGSSTGEPAPWAVQGLITHKSAAYVAGRRLTGKIFVPGLDEDSWNNGSMNPTTALLLEDVGTNLRDIGAGNGLGVYSRTRQVFEPSSTILAPLTGAVLRSRRT